MTIKQLLSEMNFDFSNKQMILKRYISKKSFKNLARIFTHSKSVHAYKMNAKFLFFALALLVSAVSTLAAPAIVVNTVYTPPIYCDYGNLYCGPIVTATSQ
ncbi:1729_t:CDS:1 [Ambispora leptoticha]|uniref:1729_t:CDS:1 n=1 Tax=Ambispora leptoticha TaxID=144679 RepID=A0A9N9CFN8_9GLOM|nr:1729_t:CDS:1 [Ambispora leptoticha]